MIRRLKDIIRPVVYEIWPSPKERMRKRRHQACLLYLEKIQGTRYAQYFTDELTRMHKYMAFDKHFKKDKIVSDIAMVMTRARLCRTVEFIEKSAEDINEEDTRLLNVGDVSGAFLKYFGKKGTSLNIDVQVMDLLRSMGMEALEGDVHDIPLPDDAVDYSFAFEIIEHVEAPIVALKELGRVTKKSIFATIPYMEKTRIRDFVFWNREEKDRKILEEARHHYHIHEFSVDDIEKIAHQAGLEVISKEPCLPFKYPRFLMLEMRKKT